MLDSIDHFLDRSKYVILDQRYWKFRPDFNWTFFKLVCVASSKPAKLSDLLYPDFLKSFIKFDR